MNNIAAHVVEIEAEGLRQLTPQLIQLPDIVTAAQLGARLIVLVLACPPRVMRKPVAL
jgi:ABC-2 type transport system ATP-binding protein